MGAGIDLGILIQNAMRNQQDFFASLIREHFQSLQIHCGLPPNELRFYVATSANTEAPFTAPPHLPELNESVLANIFYRLLLCFPFSGSYNASPHPVTRPHPLPAVCPPDPYQDWTSTSKHTMTFQDTPRGCWAEPATA
jgi:hypothetical protein